MCTIRLQNRFQSIAKSVEIERLPESSEDNKPRDRTGVNMIQAFIDISPSILNIRECMLSSDKLQVNINGFVFSRAIALTAQNMVDLLAGNHKKSELFQT
jgi:hypothetical protein